MRRLLARVMTLVVVVAAIMFVPATTASAFGPDCKAPPTPESPGRGSTSMLVEAPKTMPTGPSWADDRPVFEHYAYAGLRWNTYDLGCTVFVSGPQAIVGTGVANWVMEAPKFMVGVTNFVVETAYHPTFLQAFDPLVTVATDALRRAVFDQWVGLFVTLAGLLLIWRARKMQMNQAFTSAAWVLVVFVIASAVFSWPLKAGHVADEAVTTSLGSVNSAINGTDQADPAAEVKQNITGAVLYEQWKAGVFGSSDSPTAKKYAQQVWESTTLTWAEAKVVDEDPDGAGKKLLDAKGKQYEDVAGKIKKEDPDAYEYFTGKRDARLSAAVVALLAAIATCPFLLASSLLILAAFLLVRLGVVFFPVIATLAVFEKFRPMLKGLGMTMAAAVLNCIIFGVGTSIAIYGTGVLISPETKLNRALSLILMALFMFIMWKLLAPARKLTVMMSPNRNLFADAAGSIGEAGNRTRKTALSLAGKMAASYVGGAVAAAKLGSKIDEKNDAEEEQQPEAEPGTEQTPSTAKPSPIVLVAAPERAQLDPAPVHAGPHERPPAPERAALPPAPVPARPSTPTANPPASLPGPTPAPTEPPQSPGRAPIVIEPTPRPADNVPVNPTDPTDTDNKTVADQGDQRPGRIRLTGRRAPDNDPEARIWTPGDSAAPHDPEAPRVADPEPVRHMVVNEDGEEVVPVFDPSQKPSNEEETWWR